MVAVLLRLRAAIVLHQLRRDWWRVLMVIGGAVWSLSLIPSVAFAGARLTDALPVPRADAMVAIAVVVGIGWVLIPLAATGVDDALDPARFAPWGVSARRLMPGLTVASLTTVPALFFLFSALVLGLSWRAEGSLAVGILGVLGAVVTAVTWVFSARVATLWAARFMTHPAARAVLGAGVVAGLLAVGWLAYRVRTHGWTEVLGTDVGVAIDQLGATPLAAGLAAPNVALDGNPIGAVWRVAMLLAWAAILWLAWRQGVERVLVNPVARGGGASRRDDAVLAVLARPLRAPRIAAQWRTVAVRAIAARTARSWRSDQRHVVSAVGALVFPSLMGAGIVLASGEPSAYLVAVPVLLATSIGWGRHNDLAFDGTALWLDLVAGVRGVDAMRGRLLGALTWALPAVTAGALVAVGMWGQWLALPAVLASAMGVLGVALGVSSVAAVVLAYPVPAPGESPFGQGAGAVGASLIGQAASSVATGLVTPLVLAPLAAAIVWGGAWNLAAVGIGVALAIAGPWWGTVAAGRIYDVRAGTLLTRVS